MVSPTLRLCKLQAGALEGGFGQALAAPLQIVWIGVPASPAETCPGALTLFGRTHMRLKGQHQQEHTHQPSRCPPCTLARISTRDAVSGAQTFPGRTRALPQEGGPDLVTSAGPMHALDPGTHQQRG